MASAMDPQTLTLGGARDARRLAPRDVSPTILIGCGGTGKEVLLRLRQRFLDRYGALSAFPVVGYAMIDTDEATFSSDAVAASGPQASALQFTLGEQLFANLEASAPFIERPEVQEWWYPGLQILGDVRSGTGQIRPYSRLAFYARYRELRTMLARIEREVRLTTHRRFVADRYGITTTSDLNVYIISSLCGGTGSGIILDLAFLCRRLFPDAKLTSYLLFPHFFRGDVPKLYANSYATLKELETYQGHARFTATYPGDERVDQAPPPFDYCYIIGGRNGEAIASETAPMYDMLAQNLFLDFQHSEFSAFKRGSRANLEQYALDLYVPPQAAVEDYRSSRYYSFGLTTIGFPGDRLVAACAYRLLGDILTLWLGGDRPKSELDNINAAAHQAGTAAIQEALLTRGPGSITPAEAPEALLQHGGRSLLAELRGRINDVRQRVEQRPAEESLATSYRRHYEPLAAEIINPDATWEKSIVASREAYLDDKKQRLTSGLREWLTVPGGRGVVAAVEGLDAMLNEVKRLDRALDPGVDDTNAQTRIAEAKARVDQLLRGMDRHAAIRGLLWNLSGNRGFTTDFDLRLLADAIVANRSQTTWASPIRTDEGYLTLHLRRRAHVRYHEMCRDLSIWVGEQKTRVAEFRDALQTLRARFRAAESYYRKPRSETLDVVLLGDKDFEDRFYRYPRAIRPSRQGAEVVAVAQEARLLLQGLGLLSATATPDETNPGVFGLMEHLEMLETPALALAKDVFRTLDQDHNVFDLLEQAFPDPAIRRATLAAAFNTSKPWLREYTGHTLRIASERRRCVIGMPAAESPESRQEVETMLRSFLGSRDGAVEFRTLPDPSAIVIFQEVAGFPLCHISEVNGEEGLARHYQRLSTSAGEGTITPMEALHTDSRAYRFDEVLFDTDAERRAVAEAWEVLLVGRVVGVLPARDGNYRLRVAYASHDVEQSLGIQPQAIWLLSRNPTLRRRLLERCRVIERSLVDDNRGRVYAALLTWLLKERFGPKRNRVAGGAERLSASVPTRVLEDKLERLQAQVEADDPAAFRRSLERDLEEMDRNSALGKTDSGFAVYDGDWWVLSRGESVGTSVVAGSGDFEERAQARLERKFRVEPQEAAERTRRYVDIIALGRPGWRLDQAAFHRLDELIDQANTIEEFDLFLQAESAGGFNG